MIGMMTNGGMGGGIDVNSEEYAYLAGSIAHQMFKVARQFMCDCCRKKR